MIDAVFVKQLQDGVGFVIPVPRRRYSVLLQSGVLFPN